MAIAHENVKGRDVNPDEMWELSSHHVHNKYIKRKTDSVYCSISLSVFHSLLIFSWGNRKKPKIFIMYTWIITSNFKKSNEKCKILINIYKAKTFINNITKSSLKILPPPPKKFGTCNVIYNHLHILVLCLYNLIQNRHWHIKYKTYYIRIRKTFSFLFIKNEWKGMILWKGIYG